MKRVTCLGVLVVVAAAAVAIGRGAGVPAADSAGAQDGTIRGITISTHRSGQDWAIDAIVDTMTAIKQVGATWACTHPYAGIARDGTVSFGRWRRWRHDGEGDGGALHWTRPVAEAHAQGLKILIKPHLAYWGRFSWRGEIEFDTEEQWDRFFTTYERWIVAVAAACKDADGFVVGTELDKTIRFADRWRQIIKAVREVTDAPLTYAANWTDYERVEFWDDLDAIGIQAYFPVAERAGAEEAELEAGWATVMSKLRRYASEAGKHVVFTELGYTASAMAPVKPWLGREDGPDALAVQLRCMRVALRAVEREPRVIGAFLWKWFPPPHENGRDFRLATPAMKGLLRGEWGVEDAEVRGVGERPGAGGRG